MMRELAEALASDGHDVTVITGFPNHPSGVIFDGFKKKWIMRDRINNVNIVRVWLSTSSKRTKFRRILNFISFTFTSAFELFRQSKPELIFAVLQPLSVGVTLPFLASMKRCKLIFNVQDLHPSVAIQLGLIKNDLIIKILKRVEVFAYQKASALAVISHSFKSHCTDNGANKDNVIVIPNWIDLVEIQPKDRNNNFRKKLGLNEEHFVVLYCGTIGWVSGADILIQAADLLRNEINIRFVFVGEGPLIPFLKHEVSIRCLDNVIFSPFQQREILSNVQSISDVSFISLKSGKGRNSVPSKILGYMAAARPIIASVDFDSDTAKTIVKSNSGFIIEPENSVKLAELIRRIQSNNELLKHLGENGRKYLECHYSRPVVTGKYIDFFKKIVN
jgi:glycosyltransferase involved in cell wall biosynthesis